MSYIYQTARAELADQIARHAHVVGGRVLVVGASIATTRYRGLFACEEYLTLDIEPGDGVDIVGKAESIPLPSASFDSIVCTQVLGDVYNLSKAFDEFYRVLRPGGVAIITEGFVDSLHDEPRDFWRFTAHSLRRLAEESGFLIENIEPRGGYHSVVAQMRIRYWIGRLDAYNHWYRPFVNSIAQVYGKTARWLDRHDHSQASRIFTHGYLLIARKHV